MLTLLKKRNDASHLVAIGIDKVQVMTAIIIFKNFILSGTNLET